jgi:hypothetical protein
VKKGEVAGGDHYTAEHHLVSFTVEVVEVRDAVAYG